MTWPTGLALTGDLITAAQWNRLPAALAEASGASADYDFTSIPQDWTHLLIVASLRSDAAVSLDVLRMQFNGDTVGPYTGQKITGNAGSVTAVANPNLTYLYFASIPSASDEAAEFGATWCLIPNYADAAIFHPIVGGVHAPEGGSGQALAYVGGVWRPAAKAAINRVKIYPAGGSFTADSIATLYGLGAV